MILKNSSILYLFDLDGTLCGDDKWIGVFKNTYSCFLNGPYLNPSKFDIRWSILTGRPKIDLFLIKIICIFHGLVPDHIFMAPTWKYNYKNNKENYFDKLNILMRILDNKILVDGRNNIQKIFYIDNDTECIKYINSYKKNYRMLAINVLDFYKQEFLSIPI
jgi:hypothetical protein